jgi:hypothetical protein
MVPREIFEMINTNINLYKTCRSFYFYKDVFYRTYVNKNTYKSTITHNIFRYHKNISDELSEYIKNNTYQLINVNNVTLPPLLTHLTFDDNFNQLVTLPQSLTHLTFGGKFNQLVTLPESLTHSIFGKNFNQLVTLPQSLIYINISSNYKQIIDVDSIPISTKFHINGNLILL